MGSDPRLFIGSASGQRSLVLARATVRSGRTPPIACIDISDTTEGGKLNCLGIPG
ncbi:hypothetical protein RISK_002114 [Rhodopirellula islandica]|uniref:Uncharacterized protein n=1 Tax=Rhodopirellula islandica TaxID=595434 RepID=A0A0J1BG04_RHOIS|nr:hypothetical protein RISK_002114 [Rhodopirellula islandica]